MVNSRLPLYVNRRGCEEAMALVAGARQTAGVILAHARATGHPALLRESYQLLSELGAITTLLSREWKGEADRTNTGTETGTRQNESTLENEERTRK